MAGGGAAIPADNVGVITTLGYFPSIPADEVAGGSRELVAQRADAVGGVVVKIHGGVTGQADCG